MKRLWVSYIFFATVMFAFSIVASTQAVANKPYVEVTLKSGETVRFEYRSFIEENITLLPEKAPDSPSGVRSLGERRVIFLEKDTCEKRNIGVDNLRELEILGIDLNPCSNKNDWLLKLYLLDLDKYVGFFQTRGDNIGKMLSEQGMKGQLLDQSKSVTFRFEDIEKITFFPM